jgi:hypothetical protein|tara:strand:- start:565 stop:966 length:402 start_codon:yes stop_codon:yes gene_type:complete
MTVDEMTRKDFEALPMREWNEDIGAFRSLVILPTRRIHDSGYVCMDFVAVDDNAEPICRLSECSDVVHIGGTSVLLGEGPLKVAWSIDCMPKSKLLRLFTISQHKLVAGEALGSFDIKAVEGKNGRGTDSQAD